MDAADRHRHLIASALAWPGVWAAPHPRGGTVLGFDRGELAELEPDGRLELTFPRAIRDQLVASGTAEPHPLLVESGWVCLRLADDDALPAALQLLRTSYALRRRAVELRERVAGHGDAREATLDEALEESFPASDPPAIGHTD